MIFLKSQNDRKWKKKKKTDTATNHASNVCITLEMIQNVRPLFCKVRNVQSHVTKTQFRNNRATIHKRACSRLFKKKKKKNCIHLKSNERVHKFKRGIHQKIGISCLNKKKTAASVPLRLFSRWWSSQVRQRVTTSTTTTATPVGASKHNIIIQTSIYVCTFI